MSTSTQELKKGIPEPFFDAMTFNYTIEHGIRPRAHRREEREDERSLGSFRLPPFQRGEVWTESQKIRFVESIWLRLPIASYVVNVSDNHADDWPCDDWLLDGQQRWTAIIDYTDGRLKVFDLLFTELSLVQQRRFCNQPFPAIQTRDLSFEQCRNVYERLAYGGTPHQQKS